MSWIGAADPRGWLPACDCIAEMAGGGALMPRGTLVLEATLTSAAGQPHQLLTYDRHDGWDRHLSLEITAAGEVLLAERQGPSAVLAKLPLPLPEGDCRLRLSYGWDAPARRGHLAAELPDQGIWLRRPVHDPHPIPMIDLGALGLPSGLRRLAPAVTLIAVSDTVEAVGPVPGIAAGTPVETARGSVPVDELVRGDLVRTSERGYQPVRAVCARSMPAHGMFAPILLAAPSFGLTRDILVAPDHRMSIAGADAEYLFGSDAVLVEARHLSNIAAVPLGQRLCEVSYHQLVLDRHECLCLAGAWGESQFTGNLPVQPSALAGTAFEHAALELPRHDVAANPLLQAYEAVVLVSAIGA